MFIKLSNKFDDKYDMWIDTKELEKLKTIEIDLTPYEQKVDLRAWCHIPNPTFGIEFKLFGCFEIGLNTISIDHYKKL